jgi:hypothetical protein
VSLLVAAGAFVMLEPWHGPIVLALSEQHGLDAADLPSVPMVGLGLAIAWSRARGRAQRRWWTAAVAAIVLGALLLAGIADPRIGTALTPAGGGTFGRSTQHVDGVKPVPVGRWTHLAMTSDGATYRLYVNGAQVSRGPVSGTIRRTSDPFWIDGERSSGGHFQGVIDEARVYDRALGPAEVRDAMSTPVKRRAVPGLVAAYGFDAGRGQVLSDASGQGNTGAILGARWTKAGRFGPGLRFAGRETVRVPASASLDLTTAVTLMAWIRPSQRQSGWRIVLVRPTDAYYLAAGGGRGDVRLLVRLDHLRFALMFLLIVVVGVALARGQAPWVVGRRRWDRPVALFVAGSVADVAFSPSDTLIGPALVAAWCGATADRPGERAGMYALAAVFAAVTVGSLADQGSLPLPPDAGGVVRAGALGLTLVVAALASLRKPDPLRGVRRA